MFSLPSTTPGITPAELKKLLESDSPPRLLDVRERDEWETVRLPGAHWIPLSELAERAPRELDSDAPWVVYCHHGVRSKYAQTVLLTHGFSSVTNLEGGIDAWSLTIDPTLPRY